MACASVDNEEPKCLLSGECVNQCACGACDEHRVNVQVPFDQRFIYHKQLGEGTFGRVYLVTLKEFADSKPYALKVLNCVTKPKHIAAELRVMRKLGFQHNIMGTIASGRVDQRVFVLMDYVPHHKFKDYVNALSGSDCIEYMRNLLDALAYMHEHSVVHRDVKPANYLYNRQLQHFVLTDFGLVANAPAPTSHSTHRRSSRISRRVIDEAEIKEKRIDLNMNGRATRNNTSSLNASAADRITNRSLFHLENGGEENKMIGERESGAEREGRVPGRSLGGSRQSLSAMNTTARCACAGEARVCDLCEEKSTEHCNKAGTAGYRAPETLLRSQTQHTAVDVWAAGMIMLSLLSGRYPLLRPIDDSHMLKELALVTRLRGTLPLQALAAQLHKMIRLQPEPPSHGLHLRRFCELSRHLSVTDTSISRSSKAFKSNHQPKCGKCSPFVRCTAPVPDSVCVCYTDDAAYSQGLQVPLSESDRLNDLSTSQTLAIYAVLDGLLQVDPTARWTAAAASQVLSAPDCFDQ